MLPSTLLYGVALLLLLTPLQCMAQDQLLKNADFEQNSYWLCNGCTAGSTSETRSGQKAFLASNRKDTWSGPGQILDLSTVKPGGHYLFTSYVMLKPTSTIKSSQKLIATMRLSFKDGSKDEYQNLALIPNFPSNKWQEVSSEFKLSDYHKSLKELYLYIEGPDAGINMLVDGSSLTAVRNSNSWKTDASKRIESIRKGELTVTLETDRPLKGLKVQIKQQKHEFGFGTAIAADALQTNDAYRQWYMDNFEWAVLENALKWRQVEWTKGKQKWANADGAMKILEDNGKKVRGHTIFWAVKERNPNWVQRITNKNELYDVCMKRATDVVSRYKGRLQHWDVNNEMMAGRFFEDRYGSPNIRYDMFKKAKEVDPNVKLFLNDYNVISGGQRLSTYIGMANQFKAAKVHVDAIGVQGHFSTRPNGPILLRRLDKLAKLGLPIWVTELDYGNSNDQQRADGLEDALTAFFSHPSVEGVLFWGFYEGRHSRGAEAALVNGDTMTPNAAGLMWQRLFHKQWRTNLVRDLGDMKAGVPVSTSAKVFYGEYKISVSLNGKVIANKDVTIKKSRGTLNVRIPVLETAIG